MAIRYLGDRTKIVVEWVPRRDWDQPWIQGSYDFVFYDKESKKTQGNRLVLRRVFDLHVSVARGERWGGEGIHGTVTLGDLGLKRPELPSRPESRDSSQALRMKVIDVRDLIPCRVHEDCRESRELGVACGQQQLEAMKVEDAARAKLLGRPEVIDRATRVIVQRIVSAERTELGSNWFGARGVREDFATYGLAVRRTPAGGAPIW